MRELLGLVLIAAVIGAYAGGFYTGIRLTRPLASRPLFGQALPPRFKWLGTAQTWWLRIFVAMIFGLVFLLPLQVLALIMTACRS